jgi:hypothetical protein
VTTSRGNKAASKKGAIARASGRRAEVLQQPLQNPVALEEMPAGYPEWLADVKARVRRAQLRAAQAANGELLMFSWDLGRDITEKMPLEGDSRRRRPEHQEEAVRLAFLAARYPALGRTSQNPSRNRGLVSFAGCLLRDLSECPPRKDSGLFTRSCVFAGYLLAGLPEASC